MAQERHTQCQCRVLRSTKRQVATNCVENCSPFVAREYQCDGDNEQADIMRRENRIDEPPDRKRRDQE
jgi:hypothetical protein